MFGSHRAGRGQGLLSLSAWAAITNTGGVPYKTGIHFLTALVGGSLRSDARWSVSGESSLPSWQPATFLLCPHMTEGLGKVKEKGEME